MAGKTLKEAAAEKACSPMEVQGIAVEGVTAEALADFEFLEAMAVLCDPLATDSEQLRAMAGIAPAVFGPAQWRRIKAELRARNGGSLPADAVMKFVFDVLEQAKAKN